MTLSIIRSVVRRLGVWKWPYQNQALERMRASAAADVTSNVTVSRADVPES